MFSIDICEGKTYNHYIAEMGRSMHFLHFQRESGWCELSLHSAEGRPGAPVVKHLKMCNFRRPAIVTGPGDMNLFI